MIGRFFFLVARDYFFGIWQFFKADKIEISEGILEFLSPRLVSGCFDQKAVRDIICYHLFRKIFSKIQCQDQVIYACENLSWEVAALAALRESSSAKVAGYLHTIARPWDLRLIRGKNFPKHLSPDQFLVNTETDRKTLEGLDITSTSKIVIRSLRYFKFETIEELGSSSYFGQNIEKCVVIVFLSYSGELNEALMEFVCRSLENSPVRTELKIKTHPNCIEPLSANYAGEYLDDWIGYVREVKTPVVAIVNSYTSAGIDCNYLKLPVIVKLELDRLPFASPQESSLVCYVSSIEDMSSAIEFYSSTELSGGSSIDFCFESVDCTFKKIFSEKGI